MSIPIPFVFLAAVALTLASAHRAITSASPALANGRAPAPTSGTAVILALAVPDTPAALQAQLIATNEEWAVIYPMLQRIDTLHDEVSATADSATTPVRTRMFNGPAGGNSLDAPVVNGASRGRATSREFPFDPQKAPGAGGALVPTMIGGGARAMSDPTKLGGPSSVQTLLIELQTLVDAKDTPGWQLVDKLAAVRAARDRATRELADAQHDLLPLLSTDQVASLVAWGYIE